MDERLSHLPLLDPALSLVIELLEAAASAASRMEAGRGNAIRSEGFDRLETGLGIARPLPGDPDLRAITREAAVDENGASLVAGKGLAAESDVLDADR